MSREDIEEAIEVLEDASAEMLTETGNENYYDEAITILRQALEEKREPVGDDRVMTVVYRNVQKEDAQSFTDHPKAVWFGWCHAPYQRDDARFKLEKAITSPPASKPWVGLTDEDMEALFLNEDGVRFARYIEAKLKEKNT